MADGTTFDDDLVGLGFLPQGASRRGGQVWVLDFNRFLRFALHDYGSEVVLTWSVDLGDHLEERGWRLSVTDTSTATLYPQHDVRLPTDGDAVRAEITRVLGSLRLDLGDPGL